SEAGGPPLRRIGNRNEEGHRKRGGRGPLWANVILEHGGGAPSLMRTGGAPRPTPRGLSLTEGCRGSRGRCGPPPHGGPVLESQSACAVRGAFERRSARPTRSSSISASRGSGPVMSPHRPLTNSRCAKRAAPFHDPTRLARGWKADLSATMSSSRLDARRG